MKVISRRELFELAWEKPLVQVAADFGVTSTALKKTCARHDIPVPSRGYWQAVASGKTFPRPKLWPAKDPRLEQVRIVGAPQVPPEVQAAVVEAEVKVEEARRRNDEPAKPAAGPPPSGAEAATSPEARLILGATLKALARAKPDVAGFLNVSGKDVIACTLGAASVERAMSLLSAFVAAAGVMGHSLQSIQDKPVLVVDGEQVGFRLEEKRERTPHAPTPKELAAKADRVKWGWQTDPWPKYDHAPSGDISLIIDAYSYSGLRKTYSDGKHSRLEDKFEEILVAFAGHAALIKKRRLEREEATRSWAEAEARRKQAEAFLKREKRRGEFVDAVAAQLAQRAKLISVLEHVNGSADAARLSSMATWLRRRIAAVDALLSSRFLEISARHAGVEFDEARVSEADRPDYYYPSSIELHFWAIDETAGRATVQSAAEWAQAQVSLESSASRAWAAPGEGE